MPDFSKNYDQPFIDKWEQSRKKGMARFVLFLGTAYGIVMFIITTLFQLSDKTFAEAFLSRKALIGLGLFLIGGFLLALLAWRQNNKRYLKMKSMKTE